MQDINDGLTGVITASLQVETADTLALPVAMMTHLASRRLTDTGINIMEFVRRYNIYTSETGRPLTIVSIRGLETAGTGNTGRAMFYRRDPQVLRLHMPMPHRFLPLREDPTSLAITVPGIFRLGGLEIRRPGACRYVDGIM